MNKEIISYEGMELERIQKTTAKKIFDKGEYISIVGDNANINSPWVKMILINDIPCDKTSTFDKYLNNYYYYNRHFIKNGLKYYKVNNYYVSYWKNDDEQDCFIGTHQQCLDFINETKIEQAINENTIHLIDTYPQLP
jgi:hypothetical protein